MIKQGVGRSWRDEYPADEWETYKRHQCPSGDRIVMIRERASMRAALLSFFHKDGDLHWILHADGHSMGVQTYFEGLVKESAFAVVRDHPSDYTALPNFGRF